MKMTSKILIVLCLLPFSLLGVVAFFMYYGYLTSVESFENLNEKYGG